MRKIITEQVKIPKKISEREEYPDGANHPTRVTVYKCLCGKGTIEYNCGPGFDDDWFDIICERCDEKYAYITRCGNKWEVDVVKE